jgi:proteasome beta subunit
MQDYKEDDLKKGTTTLGMVCDGGVVLATERRATMGTLVAHKTTKKLFKIDDNVGLTVAGLVGDAQLLARYLKAEVELYKLKRNAQMSIRAASTLMANILSGRRYFPYWVALVIGGVDSEGGHVYSLDAAGGSIPDNFVTTGSGSPFVYGVLEDHYKENLSLDDGVNIAIRAMSAAMKRDAASGDGIDIVTITSSEFKKLPEEEIQERKSKLNV